MLSSVSVSSEFTLAIPALLMRRFSPEPPSCSPTLAAAALTLAGSVTSAEPTQGRSVSTSPWWLGVGPLCPPRDVPSGLPMAAGMAAPGVPVGTVPRHSSLLARGSPGVRSQGNRGEGPPPRGTYRAGW